MRKNAKWIVIALVLAMLAALFLALNPSSTLDQGGNSPSATPVTVNIDVSGGKVSGGGDVTVPLGSAVTVRVTSDAADEVHVHGYDVKADVTPAKPVAVTFVADAAGKFEVELEEAAVPLAEITVTP